MTNGISFSITASANALPLCHSTNGCCLRKGTNRTCHLICHGGDTGACRVITDISNLGILSNDATDHCSDNCILRPGSSLIVRNFHGDRDTITSFVFDGPSGTCTTGASDNSVRGAKIVNAIVCRLCSQSLSTYLVASSGTSDRS